MARRTVLLIVALVVAILGTSAVFAYVQNVDDRAIADAEPVEVLVAKEAIAAGTTAAQASDQGLVTLLTVPRKATPEGVLSDIELIRDQVALSDIFPGEMLLSAKFGAQQVTGLLQIPAKKLAMSVQLGDPERVAGFVQPGSEVAVFVTFDVGAPAGATRGADGLTGTPEQATRLLLPRVQVVAVGPTTLRTASQPVQDDAETTTEEEPIATAVLTVAVTQGEAEKLVQAIQTGQLYFGLLAKDSVTAPSRGIDGTTLFS